MNIGTPLSHSATRVMLLGSGELGKEVVISLQRLGIEVIAVDRYPNAPAMQVSHRSHVISMTDSEALMRVIKQERPNYIIPEIEAIATNVLVDIEKEGICEVIPTARAVSLTMNREGIRRLAAEELGLPTSPYQFADSFECFKEAVETIKMPCVVKPIMSSSGKGQSVIRTKEDIEKAWNYAQEAGRVKNAKVIVEGFIDFDYEITQLTVRAYGKTGEVECSFCEPIGHIQKDGDYVESWQPHFMSEIARNKSQEIAKKITDNLGGRGVFGVELFVKGDEVYFSEVSPRPHDTGLVTLITQRQSEFELHARAILGLPVNTELSKVGASSVIYGGIEEKSVIFQGVYEALQTPETDIRLFGKPESFTKRRMGVVVSSSSNGDVEEARERAKEASVKVKVISSHQTQSSVA